LRTPEGYVKHDIRMWLERQGAYLFLPVQTGMGKRTLDIICCLNGLFIAIEVKREGGRKATKPQQRIIEEIEQAGGIAFVTDSLRHCQEVLFGRGILRRLDLAL